METSVETHIIVVGVPTTPTPHPTLQVPSDCEFPFTNSTNSHAFKVLHSLRFLHSLEEEQLPQSKLIQPF
jgi:hypothetical protein